MSIKHICLVLFSFIIFLSTIGCHQNSSEASNLSTKEKNAQHPVDFKSECIDFDRAQEIIQNKMVVIIDLRDLDSYHAGHIPHAIQIDALAENFKTQINNLNRNHHYLLYSNAKELTAKSSAAFLEKGFLSVKLLEGDWETWVKSGGSIEK